MKKLYTITLLLFLSAFQLTAQEITGLSNWSIYIDPGHSQFENMGVNGYSEAQKSVRIAMYLKQMLEEQTDVDTVYTSRTNDFQSMSLSQRTDDANSKAADFFHSIHSNAGAPQTNNVLTLWGAWYAGSTTSAPLVEKSPNGGKKMGDIMIDDMKDGFRLPSIGSWGDRAFYGTGIGNTYPYLHVNRETNMASVLTEGGFHTNIAQNSKNMNPESKKLEAQTHFWSYLRYHGLARPKVGIITGIVKDIDSGLQINGAQVSADGKTYTTDTFESLFNQYTSNPDLLRNGFYYLEGINTSSPIEVVFSAEGYTSDTLRFDSLNDTTFNFADINLVSIIPPKIVQITPENNSESEPTAPITIDFSRRMNKDSTEAAFGILPVTSGSFVWNATDTRLNFIPSANLLFETNYTVSISGVAEDKYGHKLDGNSDGEGGDSFEFNFTTPKTDLNAPIVLDFDAGNSIEKLDPRAPINVVFDEIISAGLSTSTFVIKNLFKNTTVAWKGKKVDLENRTIFTLFPTSILDSDTDYEVTIKSGLKDKYNNTTTEDAVYTFRTEAITNTPIIIDNFESGVDINWWNPQQSGSTIGILTDSTSRTSEATIISGFNNSTKSMKLKYGFDSAAEGHLIRQYLGGGSPSNARFTSANTIQAYVFGDSTETLLRFMVRDSKDQLEGSPWVSIDWYGWRLIKWDMSKDAVGWIGTANGIVEGSSKFDSFQLSYTPGNPKFAGTIYIDDFAFSSIVAVSTEDDNIKPLRTSLDQNFPNPFNPSTTLTFSLSKANFTTLKVYDVLGREVATLVNQVLSAGNHSVQFDASKLASGMYIYRLEANGTVLTKKMSLIK